MHSSMSEANLYTSYSLRRAMPTLALMRNASGEETCAMGEWQSKVGTYMHVRYAENSERQATAAIAKALQVELVRQAASRQRPISLDTMRQLLGSIAVEECRGKATEQFCSEAVVEKP